MRRVMSDPGSITLEEVCSAALQLPCSPVLLPRLTAVLKSSDSDISDMAQLIQLDPVLAAATLRLANSAFFGGGEPVETVNEAVMRLGASELYRLAALSLAARWMAIDVEGYRWEAGDFCRASLVKAVAAELLARQTRQLDSDLAYTTGLVFEIGKLALAFSCGSRFEAIRTHQVKEACPWLEAERAVLGFNHAEVSARLLERWRFPEACVAVARCNPPGSNLPAEHAGLIAHVHAANYIASSLGLGIGEDGFLFAINAPLLETYALGPTMLEEMLPEVLERCTELLRDKLSTGRISQ
jgi:HD-like signal output (HDOD) protein